MKILDLVKEQPRCNEKTNSFLSVSVTLQGGGFSVLTLMGDKSIIEVQQLIVHQKKKKKTH